MHTHPAPLELGPSRVFLLVTIGILGKVILEGLCSTGDAAHLWRLLSTGSNIPPEVGTKDVSRHCPISPGGKTPPGHTC